jgi:predicted transposase YbfD/YdcC
MAMINPVELASWRDKLQNIIAGTSLICHLSVDGKKDAANKFYAIRVFDVSNTCVIRQEEIPQGANEISLGSRLFETLPVENKIVTADAIYTHRSNVRKIVSHGGDYLLALKKNQRELYDDVAFYLENIEHDRDLIGTYTKCRTAEKSRNRFEIRKCISTGNIGWLHRRNRWAGLRSISMIKTIRTIKGQDSITTRFFISSLEPSAEKVLLLARRHWMIENLCHRHLAIAFEEDRSTLARGRSSTNFSILRDYVLALLQCTESHESLREQRLSNHYQIELLLERLFLPAFK